MPEPVKRKARDGAGWAAAQGLVFFPPRTALGKGELLLWEHGTCSLWRC